MSSSDQLSPELVHWKLFGPNVLSPNENLSFPTGRKRQPVKSTRKLLCPLAHRLASP